MTDRTELRPAETVSETVPTRHETPDVAELRRKAEAAENATPGPWWHEWVDGDDWWAVYGQPTGDMVCPEVCTVWGPDGSAYIAAANPAAMLGLLDATDALRAELAHMTEARDSARAEVERLAAAVERIRELHERESFWQCNGDQKHSYPTQQDAADESGCDCPENPESVYLAHTPECLATISHFDVCSECARIEFADADRQAHGDFSGYAEAMWPCPTIRAIGGEQS